MRTVDHQDLQRKIVRDLSALIANSAGRMESERHYPERDADKSDELIMALLQRVQRLRQMREDFENEMAMPT